MAIERMLTPIHIREYERCYEANIDEMPCLHCPSDRLVLITLLDLIKKYGSFFYRLSGAMSRIRDVMEFSDSKEFSDKLAHLRKEFEDYRFDDKKFYDAMKEFQLNLSFNTF